LALGLFDERASHSARGIVPVALHPTATAIRLSFTAPTVIAGWIPQKIEVFWLTLIGLPESREVFGRTSPNTGRKPPRSSETAPFKIQKLLRSGKDSGNQGSGTQIHFEGLGNRREPPFHSLLPYSCTSER